MKEKIQWLVTTEYMGESNTQVFNDETIARRYYRSQFVMEMKELFGKNRIDFQNNYWEIEFEDEDVETCSIYSQEIADESILPTITF